MSALGKVAPNQKPLRKRSRGKHEAATRSRGLAKPGAAPAALTKTRPGGVCSEPAGSFPVVWRPWHEPSRDKHSGAELPGS